MAERSRYYWLKLQENFFDLRMQKLRSIAGGETFTLIYVKMMLLSIENNGIIVFQHTYDTIEEEISVLIGEEINNVNVTINYLERVQLLEFTEEGNIALMYPMENIGSECESAKRVREYREKRAALQCNNNVQTCNTDIEKEKEKDIDKNKNNSASRKAEACEIFEHLWKLYPCKKGKGQVSDSKKLKLLGIGYEEMERAIKRYVAELEKDTWRKPQNGSTFFNSGYVDYLDANYVPSSEQQKANAKPNLKNQFNNFQQRDYTAEQIKELEERLLRT